MKNQEFELTFIVDLETEKAYVVGNQGSEPVHIVPGNNKITFIEITGTNNVITTTVVIETLSGTDVGDSVHSRNVVIIDELVASQMYGKCTIS